MLYCQTQGSKFGCHGSSKMNVPCHSSCITLKIPHCFVSISAEYSFEYAASSGIVEQFSHGKKNSQIKQKGKYMYERVKTEIHRE